MNTSGKKLTAFLLGSTMLLGGCMGSSSSPKQTSQRSIDWEHYGTEDAIANPRKITPGQEDLLEKGVPAVMNVASAYERTGNYPPALAWYLRAINRYPEAVAPKVAAARLYTTAGEWGAASRLLESAVDAVPDDERLKILLSQAYMLSGSVRLARSLINRIPDTSDQAVNKRILLGQTHDLEGNAEIAQTYYFEALDMDPRSPRVISNIALSLALNEHFEDAVAMLQPNLGRPSTRIEAQQNLALIYALSGQTNSAAAIARASLDDEEMSSNMAFYRGLAGLEYRDKVRAVFTGRISESASLSSRLRPGSIDQSDDTPEEGVLTEGLRPDELAALSAEAGQASGDMPVVRYGFDEAEALDEDKQAEAAALLSDSERQDIPAEATSAAESLQQETSGPDNVGELVQDTPQSAQEDTAARVEAPAPDLENSASENENVETYVPDPKTIRLDQAETVSDRVIIEKATDTPEETAVDQGQTDEGGDQEAAPEVVAATSDTSTSVDDELASESLSEPGQANETEMDDGAQADAVPLSDATDQTDTANADESSKSEQPQLGGESGTDQPQPAETEGPVSVELPASSTATSSMSMASRPYKIQFVSVESLEGADREWCRLHEKIEKSSADLEPWVRMAELDDGSVRYRMLLAGFENYDDAAFRCQVLQEDGVGCFVVKGDADLLPLESSCKQAGNEAIEP